MQIDNRPYFAKFLNGQPILVARQGMDMGTSLVKGFMIEKWRGKTSQKEMNFIELGYSKSKSRSIMNDIMSDQSSFEGPDLFHLCNAEGKLQMNVWQCVLLNQIDIYLYNEQESPQKTWNLRINEQTTNEEIMATIMGIWERETGEQWERLSINGTKVDFILN